MKAAQTIIDHIINSIVSKLNIVTGELVTGAGIAIKDIKGQVVELEVSANGSSNYVGLDDSKNAYFYIRLNGQMSEPRKASNTKRGSCGIESEVRLPLKLVFQHRCTDPKLLMDAVKSALFLTNFSGVSWLYNIVSPKIYPATSEILSWVVYQTETGKEPTTLNSLMQIISIDFELKYDFIYSEKCVPFGFCKI